MPRFTRTLLIVSLATSMLLSGSAAQEPTALPTPDERYKADLLLVVAHPDDEGAATPYLARALDEHRRIAVVFGTRGSSGANEAGAEQAGALGAISNEALKRRSGARGLRAILENIMLDVMFEIPSQPTIKEVVISEDVVRNREQPLVVYQKAQETA